MASMSARRAGASLSVSLQLSKSRSLAVSCSPFEHRARRSSGPSHPPAGAIAPSHRTFHTAPLRYQEAQTAATSKPPVPSNTRPPSRFIRHTPTAPRAAAAIPTAPTAATDTTLSEAEPVRSLTDGLDDPPPVLSEDEKQVDWARSFHGLSASPFPDAAIEVLTQQIDPEDIEIKPDGIIYLPEIKYRRILNKAFGPGGWGLAPRGETIVTGKLVTREYGLVCGGRLVSIARGEQTYFDASGIPTATEGCKSNALMRCCKDLGVASELWDPRFIRKYLDAKGKEIWVEHQVTKKRRKHWMRKDDEVRYPLKEIKNAAPGAATGGMR
ncbi:hypothetical protein B0A49_09590 [Cryomyces minteri]|uniref:Mitochondrial genome maintenance protein MGM101 n=1 Tax=Cryomyces minteri TaxID=331657 RepID=A0A4U0WT25_9PEZI|nr:hypothetical protein B0A49_09590 [Cryomyces minteri]